MNWLTRASNWLVGDLESKAPLSGIAPLGYSDGNNFETNRITLAEHRDSMEGNANAALSLSTVWACVNLLAGTIGSLSIIIYRSSKGGVNEEDWDHPLYRVLYESPNADQTSLDFMEFVAASIELYGNAYSEIERGAGGRIISLAPPLPPSSVRAERSPSGDIRYQHSSGGRTLPFEQSGMLHIRGFGGSPLGGLSTLAAQRRTVGNALSLEQSAAATFKNGVRSSGVFSSETGKVLTPEQFNEAQRIVQEKYSGAMNAGRPMLVNGLKWQALSINPDDAQMLESRAFSVEEVCRMFQVPPHLIGHTSGNTTLGSSIEQQTLHFLIFTLRRRLKRIELSLEKQLLTPADRANGIKIRFNVEGLLRGDSAARATFYQTALQSGWMTINEVRALEGLPPVDGGDIIRMQMQNVPLTDLMGEPQADAA